MTRTRPKTNLRGLQDIRTHTGRVSSLSEPYRAFMRISCLEMEKARRGKERESALHRVQVIDQRFREIAAEKAELLAAHGHLIQPAAGKGRPAEQGEDHPSQAETTGQGFKVRY